MSSNLWPKALVASLIAFILMILGFVYRILQEKVDLVQENYYQKDLAYNELRQAHLRYQNLSEKPIYQIRSDGILEIRIPKNLQGGRAEILFYNPQNSSKDFTIQRENLSQILVLSEFPLSKENWRIKVWYYKDDLSYYHEHFLPKP